MLLAGEQGPADPIQRVVLAATAAEGALLDPTTDLVDDVAGQAHDVESVQHLHGVGKLVTDRVAVPAERVESGVLHAGGNLDTLLGEPVGVRLPGAALDGIEQPGVQAAVLVASQIDRDRDRLVGRGGPRGTPDVLVDAERLDALQPLRVLDAAPGGRA
jgi:hypothetical protein